MTEPDRHVDPTIEARLEAYATERLEPDSARLERLRARALADFVAGPRPRSDRLRPALVGALALILVTAAAAAASGPGQPFYGLRLAAERALLPAAGMEHTQALLAQLDQRLEELRTSAQAGEADALQAALEAYRDGLRGLTDDPEISALDDVVLNRLARHAKVLTDTLAVAPPEALNGIQQALDDAQHATTVIEDQAGGGSDPALPSQAPSNAPAPPANQPADPSIDPPGWP